MRKVLVFALYFMIPGIPIFLYLSSLGGEFDSYSASVSLGIAAFVFICNQFILASRPAWALKVLGLKNLLAFHSTMPIFIIAMAATHKILKELNSYPDDTFQARLGAIAWWVFAAVIVFTILLMANTFWLKIPLLKNLKTWVYKKMKLSYKAVKLMHNITVLAGMLLMVHVFLSSSSGFSFNPGGIIFMGFWFFFSIVLYGKYKLGTLSSKERK